MSPTCTPTPRSAHPWRPHFWARRQMARCDGRHVLGFGARVGYWPCLYAPFVRLDLGSWILEAWVGHDSYRRNTVQGP